MGRTKPMVLVQGRWTQHGIPSSPRAAGPFCGCYRLRAAAGEVSCDAQRLGLLAGRGECKLAEALLGHRLCSRPTKLQKGTQLNADNAGLFTMMSHLKLCALLLNATAEQEALKGHCASVRSHVVPGPAPLYALCMADRPLPHRPRHPLPRVPRSPPSKPLAAPQTSST